MLMLLHWLYLHVKQKFLFFENRRGVGSMSLSSSRLAARNNKNDDSSAQDESMDESIDASN